MTTGDTNGAPASYGALLQAIDGLRDDFREDLRAAEERLGSQISEVSGDVSAFVAAHTEAHRGEGERRGAAEMRFESFISQSELAQARRDGALGAVRFTIEQISRHAGRIVAILATIAAAALAVSGELSIAIGRPT